ncbi:polynucleotide adenylyltransferase [Ranunculus cassubicifolius]
MEITGFLYETLAPLSTPPPSPTKPSTDGDSNSDILDSNSPQRITVLRNQLNDSSSLTLNPSPSTTTTAIDYFSLDIEPDIEEPDDSTQPSTVTTATPPSPTGESERVLERGWFRANSKFKSPMLQLHKEILDFCEFLSPTPEEQKLRNDAVDGVFGVVKYIWPHCQVEVFGSFKTGLYLPTSDIDVVIMDSNVKTPQMGLIALSRALSSKGIAKKIQVIAKARVPIIKFVEKRSGVNFDISFDVHNGPKAAVFIKEAISKIPPLRPLCMILKVFLQQRELNEVYSGGIGSYALLSMLIAQLQLHWRGQYFQGSKASSLEQNLGVLLVNFFEFYGRKLNIYDVGVSCQTQGTYYKKDRKFLNEGRPYLLSVEDPQEPDNDIAKNSFNYSQIRSAFGMAYSTLTSPKTIMSLGQDRSILGTIIRPDPVLLERKGGVNGEMTFKSLLPGAGELVARSQFHDEDGVVGNWQFEEDEPFPRENVAVEEEIEKSGSSKKRKKREKRNLLLNEDGEGKSSKSRKEKKRQRNGKKAGENGSVRFVSGSPWGRSR